MTPEQFTCLIRKKGPELRQLMSRTLPVKVSTIAQQFVRDNFRQSGFVDTSIVKWKRAKRQDNSKHKDRGYNTLLSRRNFLFNSIKKRTEPFTAVVFSNVIYAKVHNEGGIAGSHAHRFRMPKRQFMGKSQTLDRLVTAKIESELEKLLNAN